MISKLIRRFYNSTSLRNRNTTVFQTKTHLNNFKNDKIHGDTPLSETKIKTRALNNHETVIKFDDLRAIYQTQPKASNSTAFVNFEEIPEISAELLAQMNKHGIFEPTEIQKIMLGHFFGSSKIDLLIKSQPGSGKSLGYIIMLLSHYYANRSDLKNLDRKKEANRINCKYLIIVPSELLAKQLLNWLKTLSQGKFSSIPSISILCETFENVTETPVCDFLISTPEAFRTKLAQGYVDLRGLEHVVLDEADALIKPLKRFASTKQKEMRAKHPVTSMMLLNEMMKSISTNKLFNRPRMIVSSATLNKLTRDQLISSGIVKDPIFIEDKRPIITRNENMNPSDSKVQHFHSLLKDPENPYELLQTLHKIVSSNCGKLGVIFLPASQSKLGLCELLKSSSDFSNHSVNLLCNHQPGGNTQNQLFIASDVDCRGIDIPELGYVIILDLPGSVENYIHMSGRVGRTGQISGNVYTILGTVEDFNRFGSLLKHISLTTIPFLE
jgi:ATP-dependent RNA helicase RhlE